MDLDAYMDSIQDDFDFEEKAKSSTLPSLERAPGKDDNWVEKAGGLPKYIERIAKRLHYEQGMGIGQAIASAINTVKRWAKGGGDVKPDTQAKAAAALAQWERMKRESGTVFEKMKATSGGKKDIVGDTSTVESMETKGVEYKNVSVKGLQVADDTTGVVEAIVSVTGIVDEVKDIIKPGAYAKTLAKRKPKGVYAHSWDKPVSKTIDIKELLPGDAALPKTMADGSAWPAAAGALWVKMQFNLNTDAGRDAFEEVKFYGDDQEWSIGYNVPVGGAKVNTKAGIREIDTLDLFEYSPVLFGAMPMAVTQSVKSAQEAMKAMRSQGQWSVPDWQADMVAEGEVEEKVADDATNTGNIEIATNTTDVASNLGPDDTIGVFEVSEDGVVEAELDEYEAIEAEDTGIKGLLGPDDLHVLVKALTAINDLLGTATGYKAHSQVPGDDVTEESGSGASGTVAEATKSALPDDSELVAAAGTLDEALESGDEDGIESAANDFLDLIEDRMTDADEKTADALTGIAKMVAKAIEAGGDKKPPSESNTQEKRATPPATSWTDEDFEDTETVDLSELARFRALLDGNE